MEMSFVAVAAYRNPHLVAPNAKSREWTLRPEMAEKIFRKICQILYIALLHGHDAIVLSALGCGAYGNPPRHVAKLFHKAIHLPVFQNRFRHIAFAIFDDANTYKKHNPNGNFIPFKEIFAGSISSSEGYPLECIYEDENEEKGDFLDGVGEVVRKEEELSLKDEEEVSENTEKQKRRSLTVLQIKQRQNQKKHED